MELKIGFTNVLKEVQIELEDNEHDSVVKELETKLCSENEVIWLTDKKGKKLAIPSGKIAYIEISPSSSQRSVGFKLP